MKHSYDMLVADCNHMLLLENEKQNHLFFFGDFFSECRPSWKSAQMSTFAENLRLLSVGFEI